MSKTFPNEEWDLADATGKIGTWERVGIAVLMDIRRELQRINAALYCYNALAIPRLLREIAGNTRRPKKPKATRAEHEEAVARVLRGKNALEDK